MTRVQEKNKVSISLVVILMLLRGRKKDSYERLVLIVGAHAPCTRLSHFFSSLDPANTIDFVDFIAKIINESHVLTAD